MEIYDSNGKINTVRVANAIQAQHILMFCADTFYIYQDGCYREINILKIEQWIKAIIGEAFTSHKANEIIRILKLDCYKDEEELNDSQFINVKDGLLDLNDFSI